MLMKYIDFYFEPLKNLLILYTPHILTMRLLGCLAMCS